jgi:UDPglucose 6-dehydrogenase
VTIFAPTVPSICFIDAGYIGGPSIALIADCSPNLTVNVPLNESRIVACNEADSGPVARGFA